MGTTGIPAFASRTSKRAPLGCVPNTAVCWPLAKNSMAPRPFTRMTRLRMIGLGSSRMSSVRLPLSARVRTGGLTPSILTMNASSASLAAWSSMSMSIARMLRVFSKTLSAGSCFQRSTCSGVAVCSTHPDMPCAAPLAPIMDGVLAKLSRCRRPLER